MTPRPPRLAERLMTWSLAAADRQVVLGDLAEEFASRGEQQGVRAATGWYWRQVRHSLTTNAQRRLAESARSISARRSAVRQDIQYTFRGLRKQPAFASAMVLMLAVGIGANTAIFSVVDVLLLNPYPFPHPEQLVSVGAFHVNGQNKGAGYADFMDWQSAAGLFDAVAIEPSMTTAALTGQGAAERIVGGQTTADFLRVLKVQPLIGRFFTPDEDRPGGPRVVVLSYASWRARFGGRPEAVGRVMNLDGAPVTIVGVLPSSFLFPSSRTYEFWSPLQEDPSHARGQHQYGVIARLKPGVSIERAQADLSALATTLSQQFPGTNAGWRIAVQPIGADKAEQLGRPVRVLFGAGALVLLLVCLNLAGLTLARGSGRGREMALRAALGAGRGRIAQQLVTESLVLASLGGALGLLVAWWVLTILRVSASAALGLSTVLRMDVNVVVFAAASSLLVGVLCGLAPAFYGARTDVNAVLRSGSAGGRGRSRGHLVAGLVVGELSLSLILLVGASLLTMDLRALLQSDTGLRPDGVLTFMLRLPQGKYASAPQRAEFYRAFIERLRTTAGVEAAGAVLSLPMAGQYSGVRFEVEGRPKPAPGMGLQAQGNIASPGYFHAMGITVMRGRDFDGGDTAASLPVAIIDDALARQVFPGENPLGLRLISREKSTIVGIVASVKHQGPTREAGPQIYRPLAQTPASTMHMTVRATGDPADLAPTMRAVLASMDPDVPIERIRTMSSVVAESLSQQRLTSTLLSAFGLFALVLAAVGVYVVVSSAVVFGRREIGVRVALGASTGAILMSFIRKGALLAGLAAAIGVPAAWASATLLTPLVSGLRHEMSVIVIVALGLVVVALAASFFPSRRAARLDPTVVLRGE